MEHVIKILEGAAGQRFLDYTGDGLAQNPGDGFGVKGYARQVATLLGAEGSTAAAELDVQVNALQDQCTRIIALTELADAKTQIAALVESAHLTEIGALAQLYSLALDAARFELQ